MAIVLATPRAQGPEPGLADFLVAMADVDWLWWSAPPAGERCIQFSSHDRQSRAGARGDPSWYANDDRGNYLRVVEKDGHKEHVMVDLDGPGLIARLWSANPSGLLHFDIDGQRVWSVDFAALCNGKVDGVPEPLAGMRSRGGNVYLPIPFQKHATVSAEAGDLYYHVDVRLMPAAEVVASFHPRVLAAEKKFVDSVARDLEIVSGYGDERIATDGTAPVRIARGQVVKDLFVRVKSPLDGEDLRRALQSVRLFVRAGKETTVDVPLPDFFGSSDWRPWQSRRLGIFRKEGAYCYWPMPMPDGGSIELVREDPRVDVEFALEADLSPLVAEAPLLFRASYHLVKGTPTRPFSDHLVLDAKGRGRFVGCSLLVRNPSRMWWGEGDEKITVDGETFPSWWGTGTEDYFGYAWCDPMPFSAPFHAQVQCDGPQNFGFTQLHRTHVLDSVPFQRSFRFELERWHWVETTKMDYATVAYWYGAPGATSGLPAVPPAAERVLDKLTAPPMWTADGVLEGEALRVVSCSGGAHTVQDVGLFEKMFSADGVRCWYGGKPGETLVLAVPVAKAGRHRVTIAFGQNDDAGIVQCSLGGQRLGEPFDGYHERVRSSGPRGLGDLDLPAGDVELRLEIVGQNPAAKPVHMVAIDYVKLEAIE